MTVRTASRPLRKAVWWSIGARVAGVLLLALCAMFGVHVGSTVRVALQLATTVPLIFLVARMAMTYVRYRRGGLARRPASYAIAADMLSVPGLRLMIHEFRLYTSILRLLTGRWRHGVRDGDIAVPYASGGAGLLITLVCVSVIETVVLAFVIPWPLVRGITLALDVWGVLFFLGLFASFVVRPHVIGADGSLRLRSGALLDIRIPEQDIAAVRIERRIARGKKGTVDDDGCVELSQGGETTVTVELTRPVAFMRPLGKHALARVFHFYAADPAAAVAALRVRALQNVP
ncbi:hypothetical protein ACIA5C_08075 [Actinoplanes sp. NPDC051343]|uniref:hypothetical protein n=1 Tax=Actinoplanes sp. NPDC051343 TaxID=3363906 RepID=UPI00379B86E5